MAETKGRIVAIIGTLVLVLAALTLVITTRDLVLVIRFMGGGDQLSNLIVGANIGAAVFDGVVTLVLAGIGFLMVRRHLHARKPRMAAGIGVAVALLLGINAGLM